MSNWVGSGFIPILIYQTLSSEGEEENALLTENNLFVLTEDSKELLTE